MLNANALGQHQRRSQTGSGGSRPCADRNRPRRPLLLERKISEVSEPLTLTLLTRQALRDGKSDDDHSISGALPRDDEERKEFLLVQKEQVQEGLISKIIQLPGMDVYKELLLAG